MKNQAVVLAGLFLFGVYAVPGKVCPSPSGSRPSPAAVPPCHRQAATTQSSSVPCDKMVCCLVPEASRGIGSPVVLPRVDGLSFLPYLTESAPSFGSPQRTSVTYSAQAPPGVLVCLSFSSPSRAPPVV